MVAEVGVPGFEGTALHLSLALVVGQNISSLGLGGGWRGILPRRGLGGYVVKKKNTPYLWDLDQSSSPFLKFRLILLIEVNLPTFTGAPSRFDTKANRFLASLPLSEKIIFSGSYAIIVISIIDSFSVLK